MSSLLLVPLLCLAARILRTFIIEAGSTARTQMECARDVAIARLEAGPPPDGRRDLDRRNSDAA
jgi:hypothetical protein